MATKTDTSFEGMRVTLLDGTKDRIARVMKTGYKTKGGVTIKAANIAKRGRGLIETDSGGGASAKSSTKKNTRRSQTSGSGRKTSSSKAKSGSTQKDPADMTRRELVTELVNEEVLEARSHAKGTGVDELREMVGEARGGSKKKSRKTSAKSNKKASDDGKVPRRRGKKQASSESKSSTKTRRRKSDRKVSKAKPVKEFNDKIARDLESRVESHITEFLKECSGYEMTVACVGGVFNEERLTLQIGLLPANASEDEIEAYASDMEEAEEAETGESLDEGLEDEDDLDEPDDNTEHSELVEQLVDITGQDETKISKAIEAYFANFDEVIEPKLGDETPVGTRLDYDGVEAIVVGYSDKKGKMILYVEDEDKLKLVPIVKVAGMEIIESEEDEDEDVLDDPLDMEEDEEDDDEEGDLEEDEEDDFDDEEDDEEEDEEGDEEDDDDFDDFDDEL